MSVLTCLRSCLPLGLDSAAKLVNLVDGESPFEVICRPLPAGPSPRVPRRRASPKLVEDSDREPALQADEQQSAGHRAQARQPGLGQIGRRVPPDVVEPRPCRARCACAGRPPACSSPSLHGVRGEGHFSTQPFCVTLKVILLGGVAGAPTGAPRGRAPHPLGSAPNASPAAVLAVGRGAARGVRAAAVATASGLTERREGTRRRAGSRRGRCLASDARSPRLEGPQRSRGACWRVARQRSPSTTTRVGSRSSPGAGY